MFAKLLGFMSSGFNLVLTNFSLSLDEYLTDIGVSQFAATEDASQPHFVLLTGAYRVKRDALSRTSVKRDAVGSSNATSTSTTSEPTSLTRGYAQSEDFLKDVDITEENIEENINNKIQNEKLKTYNVSRILCPPFGMFNLIDSFFKIHIIPVLKI